MKILISLCLLVISISQAHALTCAPPTGTPKDQISDAYNKSDLVALVAHASLFRQGKLAVKAVWKGNPEPKITVKFTWADLPSKGNFVVFATKTDQGYVDAAICLQLWGQREKLLRDIYGAPVKS